MASLKSPPIMVGRGMVVEPLIEGCSFSDGGRSMLVHNQKRRDPWEVDTQRNAILVVQGAIPLYALAHEKDDVGLALSHNIETNPRPPTHPLHLLTLDVGGPHLNQKRWGKMLQETTSEPMILCLPEVRFRKGIAHVAKTARAYPLWPEEAHMYRKVFNKCCRCTLPTLPYT